MPGVRCMDCARSLAGWRRRGSHAGLRIIRLPRFMGAGTGCAARRRPPCLWKI